VDSFFERPDQNRRAARARIVHPSTGREQSWTSASNFAANLDNPHGLIKYMQRKLLLGLTKRPDLIAMLDSLSNPDTGKLDEIMEAAHGAAETSAKANTGTAIHGALDLWETNQPVPPRFAAHVEHYARELARQGLTPVARELTVLNVDLNAVGQFDKVFQEANGEYVIGDVKTGRLDRAAHHFAVQCEVYSGASHLVNDDQTTEPIWWNLNRTYAVLVHVDPDTGAASTYRVDLLIGRYGANLAEQIRAFHRTTPLLPYIPPVTLGGSGVPSPTLPAVHTERPAERLIETTPVAAAIPVPREAVDGPPAAANPWPVDVQGNAESHRRMAESQRTGQWPATTEQQPVQVAGPPALSLVPPVVEQPEEVAPVDPSPVARASVLDFDALMRLSKAELQGLAKARGCSDLAHHRKWLAEWIIANPLGPVGAAPAQASPAAAPTHDNPQVSSPGPFVEPDRVDVGRVLADVAAAGSAADLGRIHAQVISAGGDQAWTDAMSNAAAERLAVLDDNAAGTVLGQIAMASDSQRLAEVWSEVTVGGSAPAKWTAEFDAAGKARLAYLQSAAPPPPSNPFSGQ
jgi:hypothetical protein